MAISDAAYKRATKRGAETLARGPIVTFVAYDPTSRILALRFVNGTAMTIPIANVKGLAGAADADLAEIEIASRGLGLHWPRLDADVWVPSLVEGVTGTRAWMAARGGASKSEAKAEAARRNGQRGGRPKKIEA